MTEPPKPKHPAKFSATILHKLDNIVPPGLYLDPFAGVGSIFQLQNPSTGRLFVGIEIEPEWAACHEETVCGDSLDIMDSYRAEGVRFDGVVTSPVYGNRMSDHHNAKDASRRRSYTHDLQSMTGDSTRALHENSSGTMYFWQDSYKEFHQRAWKLAFEVTRSGGLMFLNVSNFLRTQRIRKPVAGKKQTVQYVVPWHMRALQYAGWKIEQTIKVETPRMRDGENAEARVDAEHIIVAQRP